MMKIKSALTTLLMVVLVAVMSTTAQAGTWSVPTYVGLTTALGSDYNSSMNNAVTSVNALGFFNTSAVSGYCETPGTVYKFWQHKATAKDPRGGNVWRTVLWRYEQTCL